MKNGEADEGVFYEFVTTILLNIRFDDSSGNALSATSSKDYGVYMHFILKILSPIGSDKRIKHKKQNNVNINVNVIM